MPTLREAFDTIKTAHRLCFTPVEELDEDEEIIIDRAYCILADWIRETTEAQNKLKPSLPHLARLNSIDPECAKEGIEFVAMLKEQQGKLLLLITEISFIRDRIYDR
jgi:DNA-directed RNA polymerase subunit F